MKNAHIKTRIVRFKDTWDMLYGASVCELWDVGG